MVTIYLFRYLIFITANINFSVDLLEHDRFAEERTRVRKGYLFKSRESDASSEVTESGRSKRLICRPIAVARQALLYNKAGLIQVLMFLIHPLSIVVTILVTLLYSTYPLMRDPESNEFTHPIPRYLESMNAISFLNSLNQAHSINRLLALLLLEFLCIRLRSIYMTIRNAIVNQNRYTKLNIVQIDFAYAANLVVNQSSWLRLLRGLGRHGCDQENTLTGRRGRLIRNFVSRVGRLSKFDRLYFFNQIDFTTCFAATELIPEYEIIESKLERLKISASSNKTAATTRTKQRLTLFNTPGKVYYHQSPKHRIDPEHALQFWLYMVLSSCGVLFCLTLINIGYTFMGLNISLCPNTSGFVDRPAAVCPKIVYGAIGGVIMTSVMAVNAYDNCLMAYTAIVCYSRSKKVLKMLERELKYHRWLLRNFCNYLDEKQINLNYNSWRSTLTTEENNPNWLQDVEQLSSSNSSTRSDTSRGLSIANVLRRRKSIVPELKPTIAAYLDEEDDRFCAALKEYNGHASKDRLREFNGNIDCLIDLTSVLKKELDDLKDFFTNYLNLNFIFGTLGTSMAMTILRGSTSLGEVAVVVPLGLACFVPMVYALFLGATSESCFRQIYQTLLPLMINELNLVEPSVVHRLQRLCKHLAQVENRSFVMLGSIPLTFGFMTSLLAWIATGNLLLQRFIH